MSHQYFTRQTLAFLSALENNNERTWFESHRQEYEDAVRRPALELIGDMAEDMAAISPHFPALPSKVGGSLMRIHRDTRFSRDKRPYKTNIGIQFRHKAGKDVHAPGYYLHVEPGDCFIAIGLWHPDADALFRIRDTIARNGDAWLAARDDQAFRSHFTLAGDALVNAPRGFAKDHPLAEDLKRKDFIGIAQLSAATVTSKSLRAQVTERFQQAEPYMRFLCRALEIGF
ncbi:MAG TPA: DUF2461 domain-containing protein [Gallionella sp.]